MAPEARRPTGTRDDRILAHRSWKAPEEIGQVARVRGVAEHGRHAEDRLHRPKEHALDARMFGISRKSHASPLATESLDAQPLELCRSSHGLGVMKLYRATVPFERSRASMCEPRAGVGLTLSQTRGARRDKSAPPSGVHMKSSSRRIPNSFGR
jgi:hypothetical protein